jgi:CheY-like chemotaxis protein
MSTAPERIDCFESGVVRARLIPTRRDLVWFGSGEALETTDSIALGRDPIGTGKSGRFQWQAHGGWGPMPKTLLLADDSVTIQKVVGITFANEDVELVTVDNGDDALVRARQIKPDLVLADIGMPGLDGYALCSAIRKDPNLAHTPVPSGSGLRREAREVGERLHRQAARGAALVDRVRRCPQAPRPRSARARRADPADARAGPPAAHAAAERPRSSCRCRAGARVAQPARRPRASSPSSSTSASRRRSARAGTALGRAVSSERRRRPHRAGLSEAARRHGAGQPGARPACSRPICSMARAAPGA